MNGLATAVALLGVACAAFIFACVRSAMRRQRRRDIEDGDGEDEQRPTNDAAAGERCWLLAGSMLARWTNNNAGFHPQENEDDIDNDNDLEMEEIIGN